MKQLFTLLLMLFTVSLLAQTPTQLRTIIAKKAETEGVGSGNPWIVGAKLSFAIRDLDEGLKNNFIFSGKASTILAQGDRYSFPIYGSVDLSSDDILASESGFNVGLYPHYKFIDGKFSLFLHGGAGYKVIPAEGEATSQFKLTGGLEAHFYTKDDALPFTVSATPVYMWNNKEFVDAPGLEVVGVVPVTNNVGALFEYLHTFKSDIDNIFRIGIITIGIL